MVGYPEAQSHYLDPTTIPGPSAGCSRYAMALGRPGALQVGGGPRLLGVCGGYWGAGEGLVGRPDGEGWRTMRAAVGGEGRVPPVCLPFEVDFEGFGKAWKGQYWVFKGYKFVYSCDELGTSTSPTPTSTSDPTTPPPSQVGAKPAKPWSQLMGGVDQWGGPAPAAVYGAEWCVVVCVVVVVGGGGGPRGQG